MSGGGKSSKFKGYPSWQSRMYGEYKNGSLRRGIAFDLTIDDIGLLAKQDCHYCGAEPVERRFGPLNIGVVNGIDRVDGALHYTVSNCVTCCATCNRMKMNLRGDDFVAHILRIAAHVI